MSLTISRFHYKPNHTSTQHITLSEDPHPLLAIVFALTMIMLEVENLKAKLKVYRLTCEPS